MKRSFYFLSFTFWSLFSLSVTSQTKTNIKVQQTKSEIDNEYKGIIGDFLPFIVKFQPKQSSISQTEINKIKDIARYMQMHSDAKIVLLGYSKAEKDTNLCRAIAEKRSVAVKKVLVNNFGIENTRIIANSGGVDEGLAAKFTGTSDAVLFYEQGFISLGYAREIKNKESNELLTTLGLAVMANLLDSSFGDVNCSYCNGTGSYGGELCPRCKGDKTQFSEDKAWIDAGKNLKRVTAMQQQKKSMTKNETPTKKDGFQIREYKNGVYVGNITNGQRNGLGLFHYDDGECFVGVWKNDKISGRGILRSSPKIEKREIFYNRTIGIFDNRQLINDKAIIDRDGNLYDGALSESGKYSGKGKMVYRDGSKYEGDWKYGQRDGYGTFTYSNGTKYIGTFFMDDLRGKGVKYYSNGNKLEGGTFSGGFLTGKGKYYFANGAIYEGNFKKDEFDGYGVMTWPNGHKYEGEFSGGYRTGKGKYYFENGEKYDGYFKNGEFNGWGIYIYKDGSIYVGEYKNGKRNGRGTYYSINSHRYERAIWKDGEVEKHEWTAPYSDTDLESGYKIKNYHNGDVFKGYCEYGEPQGKGTYTWSNGDKYSGYWENGERHGKGSFTWANGDTYQGQFFKNDITGKGIKIWKNGERYEGAFRKGKLYGKGTMYYPNHKYKQGIWNNDILEKILDEGKWQNNYEKKQKKPNVLKKEVNNVLDVLLQ